MMSFGNPPGTSDLYVFHLVYIIYIVIYPVRVVVLRFLSRAH